MKRPVYDLVSLLSKSNHGDKVYFVGYLHDLVKYYPND